MRRRIAFFLIAAVLLLPALALAGHIVDRGVIDRLKAVGCDDELIVTTIRTADEVRIDTSVDGLIALKQAGYSDAIVGAIVAKRGNAVPATTASSALATPASPTPDLFVAIQGDKQTSLLANQQFSTFVKSKAGSWDGAKSAGVSWGVAAGQTLAGFSGSMIGAVGGGVASAVIGYGALSGTKTEKGFVIQYLLGTHSNTVLTANTPTELAISLNAFNDGKYGLAEPMLVRLDTDDNKCRVIGTAKGAYKYKASEATNGRYELEEFKYDTVQAEVTKTGDILSLKVAGLAPGEYAVAFNFEKELLPVAVDFMVR